jgi:hypothetical protein
LWDAGSLWPGLGKKALHLTQTTFCPCEEHHSLPFLSIFYSPKLGLFFFLKGREKEDKTIRQEDKKKCFTK